MESPFWQFLLDRLGATELGRRIWHMLPGLLPFVLWMIPHDDPTSLRFLTVVSALTLSLATTMLVRFCQIQRRDEKRRDAVSAVVGYAGSVLAMLLFFPAHAELSLTVLVVLAFGDGTATLGGMLFGRRRLPWNAKKTVFGTACFLLAGIPIGTLVCWESAQRIYTNVHAGSISLGGALLCATLATVAAAFAESLPVRTNDNVRVGIAASLAILLAQSLIGWT